MEELSMISVRILSDYIEVMQALRGGCLVRGLFS